MWCTNNHKGLHTVSLVRTVIFLVDSVKNMVFVYLMQPFQESQQDPLPRRGKLLLIASQKFGTDVNFCRNLMTSIPTNFQLDSGQQSMQHGWKKRNVVV